MSQWAGYDKLVTLTAGDDFDFNARINRIPANQRVTRAWFTIKTDPSDADPGLYQATISIIPDATGDAIIADGATKTSDATWGRFSVGTAFLHWLLPRSFTSTLPVGPDLPYDVWVQASSGLEAQMERGVIRVRPRITTST